MKQEKNKKHDDDNKGLNIIEPPVSNDDSTNESDSMAYEDYINKWGYLGTAIAALIVSSFVIGLGVLWYFQSIGFTNIYSVIISSQLSLLIFALALFQFKGKELIGKLKAKPKLSHFIIAIGAAILLVGVNSLLTQFSGDSAIESNRSLLSLIIGAVILAPIIEELGFRIGLKNVLIDKGNWSNYYYILISSIMFSFIHWSPGNFNILTLVGTGIVGITLSIIYLRTNNAYTVILTHMIYNTLIISLAYLM